MEDGFDGKAGPETVVRHPRFGDLSRHQAVRMGRARAGQLPALREDDGVFLHLTITGRCYARCKDCINRTITFAPGELCEPASGDHESEPTRDAAILLGLARRWPQRTITVCFYGGEPFLAPEKMLGVHDILRDSEIGDRVRYLVYTNGELLIRASADFPRLLEGIWLYCVSIDGKAEQHDAVRCGTHLARIIRNLRVLRSRCSGTVLFWSTLREEQSLLSCFEQFLELRGEGLVDYFFWHWAEKREPFVDFPAYVDRYGRELERLVDRYVDELSHGHLLPIVHLNELLLYLILGKERGHTACAVELAENFDIIDGQVYCCADLPPALGRIGVDDEKDLRRLVAYKDRLGCERCGVHPYCGGRCPVQALTSSELRTRQYCQLMRLHVGIVQERIAEIAGILERRGIGPQQLYDRSAFLARYTDVVP